MAMSAAENLTLPDLGPLTGSLGRISRAAESRDAAGWAARVRLSPPEPARPDPGDQDAPADQRASTMRDQEESIHG